MFKTREKHDQLWWKNSEGGKIWFNRLGNLFLDVKRWPQGHTVFLTRIMPPTPCYVLQYISKEGICMDCGLHWCFMTLLVISNVPCSFRGVRVECFYEVPALVEKLYFPHAISCWRLWTIYLYCVLGMEYPNIVQCGILVGLV